MKKLSKKQRIYALENALMSVYALIGASASKSQPVKIIKMEPFNVFQKKLRETEAEYALKVS